MTGTTLSLMIGACCGLSRSNLVNRTQLESNLAAKCQMSKKQCRRKREANPDVDAADEHPNALSEIMTADHIVVDTEDASNHGDMHALVFKAMRHDGVIAI